MAMGLEKRLRRMEKIVNPKPEEAVFDARFLEFVGTSAEGRTAARVLANDLVRRMNAQKRARQQEGLSAGALLGLQAVWAVEDESLGRYCETGMTVEEAKETLTEMAEKFEEGRA